MHASRGQPQADLRVHQGGRRDHAHVEPGRQQFIHIGARGDAPRRAAGERARIARADQFYPGQLTEHPGVMAAHRAQADHAGPQAHRDIRGTLTPSSTVSAM